MTNQPEGIPEIPKAPRMAWQPIFGEGRAVYNRARNENIADLATFISDEVLGLYFPDLRIDDAEMAEALVLRWATGLRDKFEEGIQAGIDMEKHRKLKNGSASQPKLDAFGEPRF